MIKAQVIWRGDYVYGQRFSFGEWGFVTLLHFVGDLGECRCEVIRENELPFKPQWQPMSLYGYHQSSSIPDGVEVYIKNPITMWNGRFVENGAVFLQRTREERDAVLRGDFDEPAKTVEKLVSDPAAIDTLLSRLASNDIVAGNEE